MSPPDPHAATADADSRQVVRRPRQSDGVGNALRQIFTGAPNLPADFATLLRRLPKD